MTIYRDSGTQAECRSEEHTSELQSHLNIVCRLLLEKKTYKHIYTHTHIHTHKTYDSDTRISTKTRTLDDTIEQHAVEIDTHSFFFLFFLKHPHPHTFPSIPTHTPFHT